MARSWPVLPVLALLILSIACLGTPIAARLLGEASGSVDLLNRLEPPSSTHPLGTDELGRDLLIRLLEGGRVSLTIGFAGAALAALIGAAVGLLAGHAGGAVDAVLMRLTDAVIALPLLPLLIVLAAIDPTKVGFAPSAATAGLADIGRIVLIVALFGWTRTARLVRASVLQLRRLDFITAARALGCSRWRIMLRHLLPGAAGPLIVATTLSVGQIILAESVLSYLGLGIRPPLASWGNMLTGAQDMLFEAPRLALLPGLFIFVTVAACNRLGDALQQNLHPRTS